MDRVASINIEIAKQPDLVRFWILTPEEKADLTRVERAQLEAIHLTGFRAQQQIYLQYRAGLVDEASWKSHAMGIRRILSNSVTREMWNRWRSDFSPEFVEQVDSLLAEPIQHGPAA